MIYETRFKIIVLKLLLYIVRGMLQPVGEHKIDVECCKLIKDLENYVE